MAVKNKEKEQENYFSQCLSYFNMPLLLTILLFFFIACSNIQYKDKPITDFFAFHHKLKKEISLGSGNPMESIIPEDFDGDGNDEFISITNSPNALSMIVLRTYEQKIIDGFNDSASFSYIGKMDFDADGNTDLLFSSVKKHRFEFVLVPTVTGKPAHKWVICRKKQLFPTLKREILPFKAFFHPQNPFQIFQIFNTTFTSVPRRIILFDLTKSEIKFQVKLAPLIRDVCVGKFLDPDHYEILMGTFAAGNGARIGDMDDYHSWLILMDLNGSVLYKKAYGAFGSFVWISPQPITDENGIQKVFIARYHYGKKQPGPDFVGLWSWQQRNNFPRITFPQDIVIHSLLQTKNLKTGQQEIFFTLKDGTAISIDQDLKITREKKLKFVSSLSDIFFILAQNLIGDYRKEYVVNDGKYYYILSNNFDLLARTNDVVANHTAHLNAYPHNLLIVRNKYNEYFLASMRINPVYYAFRGGLILVLLGVIFLSFRIRSVLQEQKRQRELFQENAFRSWVLDNLDMGFILLDQTGKIQSINRKARELLQLPIELPDSQDALQRMEKILKNERLKLILRTAKNMDELQETMVQKEIEIVTDGGHERWLVSAEILRDQHGKLLGKAISIKDISKSLREREMMAWTEFAGRLAHEVKTPLSSMLLATERIQKLIQKSFSKKDSEKIQKYVNFLFKEMGHLQSISESLMQLTSLSRKEIQEVSVNRIVRECVEKLQIREVKPIKLKLKLAENLPKIYGDFNQLALAIINVLKNSIDAVNEGDTIHVSTYLAHGLQDGKYQEREYIVVEIADNGLGIPDDIKDKIFQPYFSNKERGTGLGLPITQKIVEDHRGEIFFESQKNVGTIFWIYLPTTRNVLSSANHDA